MARYIDIDDFRKNAYYADTDLDIGVYLAEHGVADVVPKSEVYGFTAEELAQKCEYLSIELEAMRTSANAYKMHYENAKQEVARDIFEGIDRIVLEYCDRFIPPAEMVAMLFDLKKKYAESEDKE